MKIRSILKSLFALSALTCALSANAELVEVDASAIGDGAAFHDTVSDLEWLKLSETSNLTLSYVQSQTNVGGLFEGWSLASMSQVYSLLDTYAPNGNISLGNAKTESRYSSYTPSLFEMLTMNPTGQFNYEDGSYIVPSYGLHTDGTKNYMSGVELRRDGNNSFVYERIFWQYQNGFETANYSSASAGVYLVRDSGSANFSDVSAPASLALGSLAIGLIGAGARRKSRS